MNELGRYSLGPTLGEGGAGRVYEATWRGPGGLERKVALKVLHRGTTSLRREARIGGLLRHPHLVDVFEIGEADGVTFCAMEFCPGGSLRDHLPLSPRAVVEVGLQVCDALGYAHQSLGLVHLDLKPDNLLVSAEGAIKVADLGIAVAEGFGDDTRIRGTPGYMAPEQVQGAPVDARTDIHALGATLLELAVGEAPRATDTLDMSSLGTVDPAASWDTLDLDTLDPLVPDSGAAPAAPSWLAAVVDRCMQPDPADRYPDMASLRAALAVLEVTGPGLSEAFAPEVQPAVDRLPTPRGGFHGHQSLVKQLQQRLDTEATVVVWGLAGIGKSRVALEAAHGWEAEGARRAWWCDLDNTHNLDEALAHIAAQLELPVGRNPDVAIGRALAGRGQALLVLDTVEHLSDLPVVLAQWRHQAPDARFLLTSRARVAGLTHLDVPPLSIEQGVQLLRERAAMRGAAVRDDESLHALAESLDGIPLALELAAGRLGVLSARDVLERLDQGILRAARTDRHATLDAAFDGSWRVLTAPQREALAALSCFVDGFTPDAADAVVGYPSAEVVDALVQHALVRPSRNGRLVVPRSIRAFARSRIEPRKAQARHTTYYARFGEPRALRRPQRFGGAAYLTALTRELGNLVAACQNAVEQRDAASAVQALAATWMVLKYTGPFARSLTLCEAVLSLPLTDNQRRVALRVHGHTLHLLGDNAQAQRILTEATQVQSTDPVESGTAHNLLGTLLSNTGQSRLGEQSYRRALNIWREADLEPMVGIALGNLGVVHSDTGDLDAALAAFDEAEAIHRRYGNQPALAAVSSLRAVVMQLRGDSEEAVRMHQRALEIHRLIGNRRAEMQSVGNLANALRSLGRLEDAMDCYQQCIHACQEMGHLLMEGIARSNLGVCLSDLGRPDEAVAHYQRAIEIHETTKNKRSQCIALGNLADLHTQAGRTEAARPLYQSAIAQSREVNAPAITGHWLGRLALLCLETPEQAQALTEEAAALIPAGQVRMQQELEIVRVHVAVARGDLAGAKEAMQRAETGPKGERRVRQQLEEARQALEQARRTAP